MRGDVADDCCDGSRLATSSVQALACRLGRDSAATASVASALMSYGDLWRPRRRTQVAACQAATRGDENGQAL